MDWRIGDVFGKSKDLGPAAESPVDGDLVMFDLLRGADESDVADRPVGDVLDGVGGFGGEGADDLAGFGAVVAGVALQQRFDFGDVAARFFQVMLEGA